MYLNARKRWSVILNFILEINSLKISTYASFPHQFRYSRLVRVGENGGYPMISRTPRGVRSSYSGVSKYSSVLQNCRIWASSGHWWRRYDNSIFSQNTEVEVTIQIQRNPLKCWTLKSDWKLNVPYLHDYWSDEAYTLQFYSTGEYFETTEYELLTPIGVRDITGYPPFSPTLISLE